MAPNVLKLLKQYNVTSLKELSKELGISYSKIKNISSGRTFFSSLFLEKTQHKVIPKCTKELAELIGIVLGDGNIYQFDRCQRLTVSCNSAYKEYMKHVAHLVEVIFKKEPSVIKRSRANCYDVCLYMQDIDKALKIPEGDKIKNSVEIPSWIFSRKEYLIKCLKGLFETDGHYGKSRKFSVEYIQFCNECRSLRESVFKALIFLGYSPQAGKNYVRLARKLQVHRFIDEVSLERPFPSLVN